MPPKKKKGSGKKGKKSAKGKAPTVIDGISTEEMSKEQLEEHIVRLREELDREREERNYFQLERDKVNTFWEITKRQLEEKKADLRNKDREMEDAEERHQIEIKVYKQKVKHLLYEHQNNISELKAQNTVSLKMTQDEHRGEETVLRKDKRSLKVELKEQELAHEDIIKNLKKVGPESSKSCIVVWAAYNSYVCSANKINLDIYFIYMQEASLDRPAAGLSTFIVDELD